MLGLGNVFANFPMGQLKRYVKAFLKIAFRHPVTGVTIIPVLADGRIVMIQRRDTGEWGFPGGLIDWGEDILQTTQRELREETGLTFTQIERLVGVYSSPERDPRMHSIVISLVVQAQGSLETQDTGEILGVQAFTPEALPTGKLSHDHNQQLQDFLQSQSVVIR